MVLKISISTLLSLIAFLSNAQELLGPAGGTDTSQQITVNWSIGEIVTTTQSNATGYVTQGFEQSNFTISSIEKVTNQEINISIYPNPTANYLNINAAGLKSEILEVKIVNNLGKVVFNNSYKTHSIQLSLLDLSNSNYFLLLSTPNKSYFEKFSIVKTR